VTAAQFLIDTSALARLLRPGAESLGWDQAAAAGLIAVCPVTELEFFYSARSTADRRPEASLGRPSAAPGIASPRPAHSRAIICAC